MKINRYITASIDLAGSPEEVEIFQDKLITLLSRKVVSEYTINSDTDRPA